MIYASFFNGWRYRGMDIWNPYQWMNIWKQVSQNTYEWLGFQLSLQKYHDHSSGPVTLETQWFAALYTCMYVWKSVRVRAQTNVCMGYEGKGWGIDGIFTSPVRYYNDSLFTSNRLAAHFEIWFGMEHISLSRSSINNPGCLSNFAIVVRMGELLPTVSFHIFLET